MYSITYKVILGGKVKRRRRALCICSGMITRTFSSYVCAETWCSQIGRKDLIKSITLIEVQS
jgi:hypothetical protein